LFLRDFLQNEHRQSLLGKILTMMDLTDGTSSVLSWSQRTLARLTDDERSRYEHLCDAFEAELRGGLDVVVLVEQLCGEPSPLRELATLNLAKCWSEDRVAIDPDWYPDAADLPELNLPADARHEWLDWLSNECPRIIATTDFHSNMMGIFIVPPETIIPVSHELVKAISHTKVSHVFLVRNLQLNRLEVFKTVQITGINPDLIDRLEDEATRAGKITHPGLVQVFGAGEQAGWRYLLMEYMNGGSLADRLRVGPLPWDIAVRLFATAARALEALHHKGGLAHGDIKPENLLFTRMADDDEHLKIGDFGLSSELHQNDEEGRNAMPLMGTPGYIAPELLQRSAESTVPFDARVTGDVFALGASLYQSLAGILPYQEPGTLNLFGPLVNAYVPVEQRVVDLPDVVSYLVKRSCAADLAVRFASAAEFARALEKCVPLIKETPAAPLQAPPPRNTVANPQPTPVQVRVPLKRRHWVAMVGVAVAASLLIGWFLRVKDETPVGPIPPARVTPSKVAAPHRKPAQPSVAQPANLPDLQLLTDKGWTTDAATAALELNGPWLAALRADPASATLASRQLDNLAELGDNVIHMHIIARHPEAAAALTLSEAGGLNEMARQFDQEDRSRTYDFNSLLVQYPYRGSADRSVAAWKSKQAAIQAMWHNGLLGAEQVYVSAGKEDENFVLWAEDLTVKQLSRTSEQRANLLAMFLEHHRVIARRMRTVKGFASRFRSTLWPEFLRMSEDPAYGSLLMDGGVWDVLQLDGGMDLLQNYRQLAVAMFAGDEALPADPDLRRAAVRYMKSGYEPVLKAFSNRSMRKNRNFHALLEKGLSEDVFAVLCHRLNSGDADTLLADYSKKTADHITADVTFEDRNKWTVEKIVPQVIYLRLGIKLFSGESLYAVEKSAALVQIASDVMLFVLPQTSLDPTTVDHVQRGFNVGRDAGQGVIRELLKAEQLAALSRRATKQTDESVINESKQFRGMLKDLANSLRQESGNAVLDVTRTRMFFEKIVQVCEEDQKLRKVDLQKVRLFRMSDGRLFAIPTDSPDRPELGTAAVRRFFRERMSRLARIGVDRVGDQDADRAYREVISAWWLLGACDRIPSTL
jgi:serine/threonine protein kinase